MLFTKSSIEDSPGEGDEELVAGALVAPVPLYRQTVHVELPQPTGGVTSEQQVEERRHGSLETLH